MKKIVYFIVIFLIGAIVGAIAMNLYRIAQFHHMRKNPDFVTDRIHEIFERELKLTPAQSAEVKRILDETKPQAEALRESSKREADRLFEASFKKMERVLNEEQIKKLYEIHEKFKNSPPPPPPMGFGIRP